MFGLTGITLHHSFYRHKTVLVTLDGNTNLGGGNGAGKTTTLNLIPVFYGEDPEKLVMKAAEKDSFLDHYLPSYASFIAFHYNRADGPMLAVLYRHSSGTVAYRFIHGAIEKNLLSETMREKMKEGLAMTDAFAELGTLGVSVSSQIRQTVDYRSVIQNDKRLLNRSGKRRGTFHNMARQYCLGDEHTRMSHINELMFAVMKRKRMFSRLKSMICDTMFSDHHIGDKPLHLKNKELMDDIQSIRSFESNHDIFSKCISSHHLRQEAKVELEKTGRSLEVRLREAELKLTTETTSRDSLVEQRETENQVYLEQEVKLNSSLAAAKGDVDALDIWIHDVHERREEWDEKDINGKQAEYDNIELFQEQRLAAKQHWQQLQQEAGGLELERGQAIGEIKERASTEKDKVQEQVQNLRDRIEDHKDEEREKIAEIQKALIDDLELFSSSRQAHSVELATSHQQYLTEAAMAAKTEQEQLRESGVELEIDQLQALEDQHRLNLEAAQDEVEQSKRLVESAANQHEHSLNFQRDLQADRETLVGRLYPENGSFLADLRSKDPGWGAGLGRVIDPELLLRTDLNPEFEQSSDSLLGWTLQLEAIKEPEHAANEDFLRRLLDDKDSELRNADEKVASQGKLLAKHKKQCELDERACVTATQKLAQAKADKEAQREILLELREEHKTLIYERRQRAERKAREAERQLDAYNEETEKERSLIRSASESRANELRGKKAMDIQDLEENISLKKSLIVEIRQKRSQRINEVNAQYDEEYRRQGIDQDAVISAKKSFDELDRLVTRVQSYQTTLGEYDVWFRQQWSQLETKEAQLSETEKSVREQRLQLEAVQREEQHAVSAFRDCSVDIDRRIKKLNMQLSDARSLLKEIGTLTAGEAAGDHSIDHLVKRAQDLVAQVAELRQQVLDSVQVAKNIIQRFPGSHAAEAWQRQVDKRLAVSQYAEHETLFVLQQPEDIEILVNEQIPQIRLSLRETFVATADAMHKYYEKLKVLTTKVSSVSATLGGKINSTRNISTISDIAIVLTATIEDGDYWKSLKLFNNEWSAWSAQRNSDLPPDALLESLSSAMTTLESARISSDIESLVNMHITMKENGRPMTIRSDMDLDESSSNGLSLMAICIVFIGMTRFLCPNRDVGLTWPIDELACLESSNIVCLFEMLASENITLLSAFPNNDHNILKLFNNRLMMIAGVGCKRIQTRDSNQAKGAQELLLVAGAGLAEKSTGVSQSAVEES